MCAPFFFSSYVPSKGHPKVSHRVRVCIARVSGVPLVQFVLSGVPEVVGLGGWVEGECGSVYPIVVPAVYAVSEDGPTAGGSVRPVVALREVEAAALGSSRSLLAQ